MAKAVSMGLKLALAAGCVLATTLAQAGSSDVARNLAASCAGCHGTAGRSVGGMASLAGVPSQQLLAKLQAYATGEEPSTIMQQIVKGYSEAQLELIAGWFAAQRP